MTRSHQTALVTGASSGIGLETARALAQRGMKVGLVSRGSGSGEQVTEKLKRETGNPDLHFFPADLSSLSEVRRVAGTVKETFGQLDVLVNNAGALFRERRTTVDGYEKTFALDHLNYFLLTQLLLEALLRSPAPRIVNVASAASNFGKIHFDDLMLSKNYGSFKAYGQAKLANVMFTYQLSRFLEDTPATVNALHPGGVATGFGGGSTVSTLYKVFRPFLKTPAEGAETVVYLATSPEVKGVSGRYFTDKKSVSSSKRSYSVQVQARLWRVSRHLVGLTGAEGAALRKVTPPHEKGFL